MISNRLTIFFVSVLLLIFGTVTIASAVGESLTFDEIVHIQEGKNAWQQHEFLIDTNNPPFIRELAVIPLLLGANKDVHSLDPNIRELPARLVIVLMGLLLGFLIFIVGKIYFGSEAGLFALFLYVFEPNILAHSHYITQDLGAALFFFLAYLSLIRMVRHPTFTTFVTHGLLVGLMAASKITTLPFYVLSSIIALPLMLGNSIGSWFRKTKFLSLIALPVCFLVIWSTYFFKTNVIVAPSDTKGRVSAQLENVATKTHNQLLLSTIRFLRFTPVPLGDYIAVIKNTLVRSTQSSTYFFLGTYYPNSRWYFMIVNFLLKTPLPVLIFVFIGAFFGVRKRKYTQNILLLLVPVIAIIVISSASRMQPLIRYILPMYPFIILIAACVLLKIKSIFGRIIITIICVGYVFGTLGSYPHFLSYTNELAGRGIQRNLNFIDSNMDWGQSLITFRNYVRVVKPKHISFSYFGRDDGDAYGLVSSFPYGSHKNDEICKFHEIELPENTKPILVAISLSNWYTCGFSRSPLFDKSRIKGVVGNSVLLFPYDTTAL